jgi:hypothetical protein
VRARIGWVTVGGSLVLAAAASSRGEDEALRSPDPLVRAAAVSTLGGHTGSDAERAARLADLARLGREDPDRDVRRAAFQSLSDLGGASAGAALLELLRDAPAEEQPAVARALAEAEGAGAAVIAAVGAGADPAPVLAAESWAPLLEAYGRALPDDPGLGGRGAGRLPFVLGSRAADPRLREAVRRGLDEALSRYVQLGQAERAEALVAGLDTDGLDVSELEYRRALLALSAGAQPERGSAAARRLVQRSAGGTSFDDRMWTFYGHYLGALGQLAARTPAAAAPELDAAALVLRSLRADRYELREPVTAPRATLDSAAAAELLEFEALVEWLRLLCLVAGGAEPSDPRALELAARVHRYLLDAQRLQLTFDAQGNASSFDAVLNRPEGPRRVLLSNTELPAWSTGELLDVYASALTALAAVAEEELPGIEPAVDDGRAAWNQDPARAERVAALRLAELVLVNRRIATDRTNRRLWLSREAQLFERIEADRRDGARSAYLDYRFPSLAALDLSRDLRADGDSQRALRLAEELRTDLQGAELIAAGSSGDEVAAIASREIGAALTDLDRPQEAEAELQGALQRLEALDNSLLERQAEAAAQRLGALRLTEADPQLFEALERQRDRNRRLRADVLTALAVNSNVRLHDPDRALEYFERAYALEASPFARVLLACYRARAGRAAEARFLLESIPPSPEFAYNLACTYAQLGETELALEFLAQELRSPRQSPGARARQREWAAADPDLVSLRADPRFQALVAGE